MKTNADIMTKYQEESIRKELRVGEERKPVSDYFSNCGAQVPDGTKFCPSCGKPCSTGEKVKQAAEDVFNKSEQELGNAFEDVKQNFQGGTGSTPPPYSGGRLKEDRSLVTYILLSLVTCGIYGYYFIYKLAEEVNIACEGDGEQTSGLVAFILLSFITCGIYAYYWYYKLGNRLAANAIRYNLNFQENGTTVLMWCIFGAFLCGIGQFFACLLYTSDAADE